MKKAALLIVFFLLSIFYLLPSAAYANTTPQTSNYPAPNTNPNVPNNLHNWTQTVMIEVMSSLTCQIAGVDPINPKQPCLGADQKTGKIGFLPSPQTGGAIGFMGNMISVLYTPPLHTADYFQNLAQNFGISKKTYAKQTGLPAEASAKAGGTGFQSLTPLIGIWSAFRNIVYLLLVIVFVVIGLAIMLRMKIDPRTVMTIQNQIPKIIVGILAVTFSFAIAGFLIDMMWVFIYLIFGIFSGIPGVNVNNLNPSIIQGQSAMGAVGRMSTTGIWGIAFNITKDGADIIKEMLGIAPAWDKLSPFSGNITNPLDFLGWLNNITNIFGFGFNLNPFSWLINVISAGASLLWGFRFLDLPVPTALGNSLGWITNLPAALPVMTGVYAGANLILREVLPFIILYLIIFIALFTALFRLWFTLLMAYVQILLGVVLAPFWIIGGIIPGSPISLSGWLKNMAANLLAFPATLAMFMLGKVFMDTFGKTPSTGQNFVPPLIGNPGDPSLIGALIGLGIILMTPNVVTMLKAALKAPKTDTGIGKLIGAGAGVVTGTIKSSLGAGAAYVMGDPLTGKRGAEGLRATLQRKFFG